LTRCHLLQTSRFASGTLPLSGQLKQIRPQQLGWIKDGISNEKFPSDGGAGCRLLAIQVENAVGEAHGGDCVCLNDLFHCSSFLSTSGVINTWQTLLKTAKKQTAKRLLLIHCLFCFSEYLF